MPWTAPVGFTPDPDALWAMNATCSIDLDANARGSNPTDRGGYAPDYRPVPELDGVPFRPVLYPKGTRNVAGVPEAEVRVRCLFAYPIVLGIAHRIRWADPDQPGRVRYLLPVDRSVNAALLGVYWAVECEEKPPPP